MQQKILTSNTLVEEFFSDFNKEKFSFDTETTSLSYGDLELVGLSFSDGENNCYIPVGHKHKASGMLLPGQVNLIWLLDYLKENLFYGKKKIVCHNFVYDYKVLYKYGINLYNHVWYDTMVAHHLLDECKPHGLKSIVLDVFGDKYGIDVANVQYLPIEEAAEYAIKDAFYTFKLSEYFTPKLEEQGLLPLFFKVEMPFLRAIGMMEIEGVDVDWGLVNKTTEELKKAVISFEEEMYRLVGEPYHLQMNIFGEVIGVIGNINFNSRPQLVDIIQNKLGLEITKTTDTGNLSVGKDTISDLKGQHPFIDTLQKYKIAQKLLNAFFEPLSQFKENDGKVRASFHDTGTRTGRLSSSQPNLQQLPRLNDNFPVNTRACFVVPKGYKMIVCDYSGQELRVLAHITNAEKMIEAFKSGKDFHSETAEAFGVDRVTAKAINFGIAYRKGAYGFSKDWGVSEEEAQAVLDKYFTQFPEVKRAMEQNDRLIKKNLYTKTLTGRRRRFLANDQGYVANSTLREGFNFLVQGFSADMIRIAAIKCLNIIKNNPSWDMKMIFTVHDEIGFKVKEEYSEQAKEAIHKAFVEAVKLKVPVEAEIKVANNYGECK